MGPYANDRIRNLNSDIRSSIFLSTFSSVLPFSFLSPFFFLTVASFPFWSFFSLFWSRRNRIARNWYIVLIYDEVGAWDRRSHKQTRRHEWAYIYRRVYCMYEILVSRDELCILLRSSRGTTWNPRSSPLSNPSCTRGAVAYLALYPTLSFVSALFFFFLPSFSSSSFFRAAPIFRRCLFGHAVTVKRFDIAQVYAVCLYFHALGRVFCVKRKVTSLAARFAVIKSLPEPLVATVEISDTFRGLICG